MDKINSLPILEKAWITNNQQSFKGIGEPLLIGTGYGIMAKNNSQN